MASDSFTNTNGTALGTHDANWTVLSGRTSAGEIQSNAAQALGGFQNWGAYYSGSSEDTCQAVNKATTIQYKAVCVRGGSSTLGYALSFATGSGGNWTLCWVMKNGLFHANVSTGGPWSQASDHTMKITVSGTTTVTIDSWVDGVSQTQTSDSVSPIGSGSPGMYTTGGNATVAESAFDDWTDGVTAGADKSVCRVGPSPPADGNLFETAP